MTQLVKLIEDWEMVNGFTVNTLDRVKRGGPVKGSTAYRIALALGQTQDEAKKIAESLASSVSDDEDQTPPAA